MHLGLASDKHHSNVERIPVSESGALLRNTSIVLGSLADKLAGEKFNSNFAHWSLVLMTFLIFDNEYGSLRLVNIL